MPGKAQKDSKVRSLSGVAATVKSFGSESKRSLSGVAATVKSFGSESNRSLSGVAACVACREWQQV